ncbi:MAG: GNAT family N-acetyltransferase [Candidatus Micrarchaeia archaeon]|jgi:GNAT superfamily N-acetyltransferase
MPSFIPENELSVVQLNPGVCLDSFSCGDSDLDDFIKIDSPKYQAKSLVSTYICLYHNQPVGYFSICMDAIKLDNKEKVAAFGSDKQHKDFPAMKIARLGVSKDHQHEGIGTFMVMHAIGRAALFSKDVGCRFVTVDAYPKDEVIKFYKDLRFLENTADKSGENVSMRFDLIPYLSKISNDAKN